MQLVCRLWKEAIVSSPSLWSNIKTSMRITPDRFETLLKLSKPTPLDVVLTSASAPGRPIRVKRIDALLDVLDEEIHRLRSLEIVDGLGEMIRVTESALFEKPLPRLESLTLDIGGRKIYEHGFRCVLNLAELFRSTSDTTTPLKRLRLRRAVPWPTNCFPNLTHLSISNAQPGSGGRLDPFAFLEFMRSSPNLVHLTLDTFGPIECPPKRLAASMPNLREVRIRNTFWQAVVIVLGFCLVLPATASVQVLSIDYGMSQNVLKWLLGPDAVYLRNAGAPRKLDLALNGHTISVSWPGPSGSMELKLNAQLKPWLLEEFRHQWPTTALTMLPRSLDLRDVEDLSLAMTTNANVPSRVMREFLLKMPNVRSCTVLLDPFIHRRYWTRCLLARNLSPTPFPHLQRLQLVRMHAGDSWISTAAQIASLVARRSLSDCDGLAELVCSTIRGPDLDPEATDALTVGRCHVKEFVGSLKLEAIKRFPPLRAVLTTKLWDNAETRW